MGEGRLLLALPGNTSSSFWEHAHGRDWAQVVDADTDLLRRFAESGGDWFKGRLIMIRCPVLFSASKRDSMLPRVRQQTCGTAEQVAESRVFLNNEGEHPLMWSCPQVFGSLSDCFLKEVTIEV